MNKQVIRLSLLIGILTMIFACSTIAPFNKTADQQDLAIKAEALSLMDKATESFTLHKSEIENLKLDMEKAYEYAKAESKNEITTKQWEIVKDPNGNSLGGFLKKWEDEGSLSPVFITGAKKVISGHFDSIIRLEEGKKGS
ncbi:MAG: hypothetical protein ABSA71_09185 [Desulfomonilia bacterium]|jgi:hypothetical protein